MDLTGNKDADLLILGNLDDRTLFQYCEIGKYNEYVNRICNDEYFWMNRLLKTFGNVEKRKERTWKNFYLNLVYYNEEYPTRKMVPYDAEIPAPGQLTPSILVDDSKFVPLMTKIATNNDFDILNYLMASKGFNDWEKGLEGAINGRNVIMVKYFLNRIPIDRRDYHSFLLQAIHKGDVDIVNIFLSLFDPDDLPSRTKAVALSTQAEAGNIAFLKAIFPVLKADKKVLLKLIDFYIAEFTNNNVRFKEVFPFLVDTYFSLGGKKNKLAKLIKSNLSDFKKNKDQSFPNLLKKYL